ncbi:MAG: methylated-DNA--[protein]-cysteine S-methyltransferase [Kiloniellales bacterium]|nr:methylated-DNA--[protein]-cysteine S-methyltransferase [Kiloniellales bacterium]
MPEGGMTGNPTARRSDRDAKSGRQLDLVRRACELIEERVGEPVTLAALAEELGASPWHLQRVFKKATGVSPRDYADARRAARFRSGLRHGDSIAGATYEAGYGSSSRVYEGARWQLGMTPASYAKGGRGAEIVYDIVDSPLGRLLVAATEKGICFVSLDADDETLVANLKREFPAANALTRDSETIGPALELLVAYLDGETPHLDLPLDVQATAFQRRVWQELIAIPPGETRSYSEVARAIGNPAARRAVGRACATNPVALIVPCHRVVRGDGAVGNYRWGVQRKEALLAREAAG